MFGWVGEIAGAFASIGPWGIILLTMLIIVALLIRQNSGHAKQIERMHTGMVESLDRSSAAHHGVTRVLGRIEGILGLGEEDDR